MRKERLADSRVTWTEKQNPPHESWEEDGKRESERLQCRN